MKLKLYFSLLVIVLLTSGLLPGWLAGTGAQAAAASITGYKLVNADNDQDLFDLSPGMTIDMALLPTRNINIRAETDVATGGSVVFSLTGPQNQSLTENIEPYALFSDFQGDYFAWAPPLGSYTLVASPFDGPSGTGTSGAPLTMFFTIINTVGSVTTYTLVNADTDLDIQPLTSGMTLDLTTLPTRNLNIRADVSLPSISSVAFDLSGAQTRYSIESIAPYALFSDLNGNYDPWTPAAGTYTLVATPYSVANAGGPAGATLTVSFTVVDAPLPVELVAFSAEMPGPNAVQLRWSTASELNNREFVVERSVDGRFFSTIGTVAGHGNSTSPHAYSYQDKQLPNSPERLYYRLRQVDNDGSFSFSPVRTVAVQAGGLAFQTFLSVVPDGLLHYTYTGTMGGTEALEMYSILGQHLGHYPVAADGTGTVPIAALQPGTYVLHLVSAMGRFVGRFVVH